MYAPTRSLDIDPITLVVGRSAKRYSPLQNHAKVSSLGPTGPAIVGPVHVCDTGSLRILSRPGAQVIAARPSLPLPLGDTCSRYLQQIALDPPIAIGCVTHLRGADRTRTSDVEASSPPLSPIPEGNASLVSLCRDVECGWKVVQC